MSQTSEFGDMLLPSCSSQPESQNEVIGSPPAEKRRRLGGPSAEEMRIHEDTPEADGASSSYSRKEKSLSVLCTRFVGMFGCVAGATILLDEAAWRLSVERRRIYDIVNVLESVNVVERKAKNRYVWRGVSCLPHRVSDLHLEQSAAEGDAGRERSLLFLSRLFVAAFLSSENHTISLEVAASQLATAEEAADPLKLRTKTRRLYDIANILCAISAVERLSRSSRKAPFRWIGSSSLSDRSAMSTSAVVTLSSSSCSAATENSASLSTPLESLPLKAFFVSSSSSSLSCDVSAADKKTSDAPLLSPSAANSSSSQDEDGGKKAVLSRPPLRPLPLKPSVAQQQQQQPTPSSSGQSSVSVPLLHESAESASWQPMWDPHRLKRLPPPVAAAVAASREMTISSLPSVSSVCRVPIVGNRSPTPAESSSSAAVDSSLPPLDTEEMWSSLSAYCDEVVRSYRKWYEKQRIGRCGGDVASGHES